MDPGCVGYSAAHAMPGIFQLDIAKMRLAKFRGLAGAQYGEKGQICVIRNICHLAGEIPEAQVASACSVEDMRRCYACNAPRQGTIAPTTPPERPAMNWSPDLIMFLSFEGQFLISPDCLYIMYRVPIFIFFLNI